MDTIPKYYVRTNCSWLSAHQHTITNLDQIIEEIDDKLEAGLPIMIFGKIRMQKRSIGFFSNDSIGYKYSNRLVASKPLTEMLTNLLSSINQKFDSDFNGILINKYVDGNDYIGKHSDDETALSNAGVVIMSYGASRTFRIRNKTTNDIIIDIPTDANEILVMGGDFQKEFTHEIPIEKKIKQTRYSLTFRKHLV
jgi:alkylated DNA repair dioxygenase AlkB